MQTIVTRHRAFLRPLLPLAISLIVISGCGIHLIAPYNAETKKTIFQCAKQVDRFYGELLETNEQSRQYAKFSEAYVAIEAELNALVFRNKVRSLNTDSIDISERILKLWQKYKARHKEKDTYTTGNAELNRDNLARMFAYAVRAEGAKKPGDQ